MSSRKFIYFSLGPICIGAISLFTLPILTWLFSAEDIGRISLLHVAVSFSFVVFSLALEQGYVREFFECSSLAALLKAAFLPGLILVLSSVGFFSILGVDIGKWLFGYESSTMSLMVCICVVANFVTVYSSLTIRMRERALSYSMIGISSKLIFLLLVLSCIVLELERSFLTLMIFHLVAILVTMTAALWLSKLDWLEAYRAPFDYGLFLDLLRFSMPLALGGVAYWGLVSIDRLSIRLWSDYEQLGVYAVAVSFAGVAVLFQSIFTTIWTPIVYRWSAEGLDTRKFSSVGEHVLAVVVFVYSLVGMFSWVISYLLPSNYGAIQFILPACMGAPLLYMLSETTVVGINLKRKTIFSMMAPLIALALSLLLNYILVPLYGAAGAAASTSLSFFVFLFLRTEFSAWVWRSFPRSKMYSFSLACSALSALQAIFYENIGLYVVIIWSLIFIVAIFFFKPSISALKQFLICRAMSSSTVK